MADPLSIASSVAGLISVTAQIAATAKTLYTSIKDAPESVNKIEQEMDDMHLIFCEVQLFLAGQKKRSRNTANHLTMISLHSLMATLSGCVLVCTNLDKKISEVAGIRSTGTTASVRVNILERVKWALWKEVEAAEIIEDLQRHKLSLNLMLSIIQCNNTADAADKLAQLHEVVSQILDSNRDISRQLRELISRQDAASGIPSLLADGDGSTVSDSTNPEGGTHGINTMLFSSPGPRDTDTASIRTTSSIRSTLSIKSFTQELKNSRAYKRLDFSRRGKSSSQSTFTLDSTGTKGDTWSTLSDMSLGGLSISEISVLELPISISDLHDPEPFQITVPDLARRQKQSLVKVNWTSKGRLHNAITNDNLFLVRSLLNLGADIEEDFDGYTPLNSLLCLEDKKNTLRICKELLDWGASVNKVGNSGDTPLLYASRREWHSTELFKLLLDGGADVNFSGPFRRTALSLTSEGSRDSSFPPSKLLLDRGADVNSADFHGRTPLTYAAMRGSVELCRLLLERGANIDSADSAGRTPLSSASSKGGETIEACKFLLDQGADIKSTDSAGRTPLSYACENKHSGGICTLLLDRGADINSPDSSGRTPLSHASTHYSVEICKLLLERGADVHSANSTGRTPLSFASTSHSVCSMDICNLLLDQGADVNSVDSAGRTPLSFAGTSNSSYSVELCKLLIHRGANIDSADSTGRTPLSYASTEHSVGVCELLLDRGADVNSADLAGRASLSFATSSHSSCSVEICELLLHRGANINSPDSTGRTPLSYASEKCSDELFQLLLDRGADVNSADSSGRTPLSYASGTGILVQSCHFLLAQGANINSGDFIGRTPLSYASEKGALELCDYLLCRGADVNSADFTGRTPLSYASSCRSWAGNLCKLLLLHGADANSPDCVGRTPLSYAAECNSYGNCEVLLMISSPASINTPDSNGRTPVMYVQDDQYMLNLFRQHTSIQI